MNLERLATRAGFRVFNQGKAVYNGARVGTVTGVEAVLDRNYEVFDEDGVSRRVTVMSVPVAQVPYSDNGDTIVRAGEYWQVTNTLDDDGHERVLQVT